MQDVWGSSSAQQTFFDNPIQTAAWASHSALQLSFFTPPLEEWLKFDTLLSLTADLSCLTQVEAWGQNARGEAVRHPILDNIRRCSSTPDEAVDFFSRILNCLTDKRPTAAQALEHPYIRRCVAQMRACQQSQPACIQDPPLPIPAPTPALEDEAHTAPIPISTLEDEAHIAPVKQKLLVRVGGAVKKHGGRLARTAGHMLKSLPMFSCTSASNDTGGSDRASSSSMSSSGSSSSSSTKPPLSAYFFDYKHEVEQHSLMQGDKGQARVALNFTRCVSQIVQDRSSLLVFLAWTIRYPAAPSTFRHAPASNKLS